MARVRNDGGEGVRPGILEIFKESAGVRVRASLEPLLLSAVFAPVFRLESRKLGKIRAAIRFPGRWLSRTAIDRRRKSLLETRVRRAQALASLFRGIPRRPRELREIEAINLHDSRRIRTFKMRTHRLGIETLNVRDFYCTPIGERCLDKHEPGIVMERCLPRDLAAGYYWRVDGGPHGSLRVDRGGKWKAVWWLPGPFFLLIEPLYLIESPARGAGEARRRGRRRANGGTAIK